jgi:predicted transport protein
MLVFMQRRNIVGKLINFRGLVYAPVEENGVIFLFSKLTNDLNLYIETIRKGFPDCIAKRYVGGSQWEDVKIEFEFKSSDFVKHKHLKKIKAGTKCDMIVCWEHDWKECPKEIEVLELKSEYKKYPNEEIEEPDKIPKVSEYKLDDLYKSPDSKKLYEQLHDMVIKIDKKIWRKVAKNGVMYYSPEQRVFFAVNLQKQALRLELFTSGKKIAGVEPITEEGGYAQKWGRFYIKNQQDLTKAKIILQRSLELIRKAILNKENTGWYAKVE